MDDLIEALNSDGWKDFDMSSRSLEEWIAIARHIQLEPSLSKIDRIFIPGRIAKNLDREGTCQFDKFNQMLVASGGIELGEHFLSGFAEPIEIAVFPDNSVDSIASKIRAEIQWRYPLNSSIAVWSDRASGLGDRDGGD